MNLPKITPEVEQAATELLVSADEADRLTIDVLNGQLSHEEYRTRLAQMYDEEMAATHRLMAAMGWDLDDKPE